MHKKKKKIKDFHCNIIESRVVYLSHVIFTQTENRYNLHIRYNLTEVFFFPQKSIFSKNGFSFKNNM